MKYFYLSTRRRKHILDENQILKRLYWTHDARELMHPFNLNCDKDYLSLHNSVCLFNIRVHAIALEEGLKS